MGSIRLSGQAGQKDTLVPNRFLDYYMPDANGEFVKIYLYLLRALSNNDSDVSVCHIADIFNHTEKDVIRALNYWKKLNLLDLSFDENKTLSSIILNPIPATSKNEEGHTVSRDTYIETAASNDTSGSEDTLGDDSTWKSSLNDSSVRNTSLNDVSVRESSLNNASVRKSSLNDASFKNTSISEASVREVIDQYRFEKHTYTANEIAAFKSKEEVFEFLYLAEKYIGKPLSGADVNTLVYIYDVLHFAPELIEYLLEYCVTNGHKSLRYIEKVALSWAEENINTLELAKSHTDLFSKNCYPVLKAFGLNGRNPGTVEKAMIVKWTDTYGFQMDIISEACNRTINTIHQPSFDYADSILSSWKKKGVKSLSDIKLLDDEHLKSKNTKTSTGNTKNNGGNNTHSSAYDNKGKNSFNNFNQRSYDYEELEKKLLGNA